MVPSIELEKANHLVDIDGVKLLKLGVILGANSSGKSNLLKAINVGKDLIIGGPIDKYRNYFCKIKEANRNLETLFEFAFFINDKFYTYGFTVNLSTCKFLTEYLYLHNPFNDQEEVLFERSVINKLYINQMKCDLAIRKKLNSYFEKYKEDSTSLLITTINKEKELMLDDLKNVFQFFSSSINFNYTYNDYKILNFDIRKEKDVILDLLKEYDTLITDIVFESIDYDLFQSNYSNYENFLKSAIEKQLHNNYAFCIILNQTLYYLKNEDGILSVYKVLLKHENAELAFEFFEESDGIRRIFDLIEVLLANKPYNVYLFDELNRYIHPLLLIKYLQSFIEKLKGYPVQLIFTSHEVNILKEELLRRDEVWFVERERDNSSKVYSLDIFKLTDKKILDSYLDGNFGAIPIFIEDL